MRADTIRKLVSGAAAAVLVTGVIGIAQAHGSDTTRTVVVPASSYNAYPPCASGDGSGPRPCLWNAGTGLPFYVDRNGDIHLIASA